LNINSNYILISLFAAFFIWRWFKMFRVRKNLPGLLQAGAILVDVRSPEEFAAGHASGSINLPLQTLEGHVKQLDKKKTIILCCASGTRSGLACRMLKKAGFANVINGGIWQNLVT
jgi:phage shock protein E